MITIKKYLQKFAANNHLLAKNFTSIQQICVFEFLAKQQMLNNESIITELIQNYKVPHINVNSENIKPLGYSKINEYYKKGYFVFEGINGEKNYAINNISLFVDDQLKLNGNIFFITQDDLFHILEREFSKQNTHWSITHLESLNKNSTAKNINYGKMVSGFSILFFATFTLFLNAFSIINNFAYLLQNILKAMLFNRSLIQQTVSPCAQIDNDLPVYSILIPLYKEEFKITSLISAMKNMNYPKNKLDVKFVIESDDITTLRAIKSVELPSYIHVIKVPYSLPRTKPKALNYAMAYVKGELLAIYDAEDTPDPDQLLKVVYAFNNMPDNYACIQAKLNFYNAEENILTRFFSIEYSVWFEYLLNGLSLLDLPVTLGGTSNHFKVDRLKEVGYWDAYNVTEDADLGIRLYLHGYRVSLINSTTMEEAPTKITVWLAQRSRWIKGFFQTFYVFIKTKKDPQIFNYSKQFSVYVFVRFSTYSFFCLPWLLISLALDLNKYIYYFWAINSLFSFAYVYFIAYFILMRNYSSIKQFLPIEWAVLILWPAYFILHSIACYRAIWELITSPFKWNKTPHGDLDV